ncbi:zinc finger protein 41 [Dermatophagoides farinae]|uniref:Zinc finger protein 41 n=1 Tax=Dermatophagoides farinae TaxID=6954 RepID=A0A9D4SK82_DERFA|nr:zinc finger protein 41 [Dermatophagoides farinae]
MDFQSEFTNNDPNGYQTIGRQVEIDSNDNQRLIIEELFESTMNAMETAMENEQKILESKLEIIEKRLMSRLMNIEVKFVHSCHDIRSLTDDFIDYQQHCLNRPKPPTKRRSERLSTKRSNDVVVNAAIDDNQESDLSGSTTDDDEDEDEYTAPKNRKKATTKQSSSSLSCPKCSFKFESEAILNSHLKTHVPGREQICELCGNLFTRKSDLDRHNRTVHSDVKRLFKCQFCNYACSLELSLQKTYTYTFKRSFRHDRDRHMQTHTNERPYYCKDCNINFRQKYNLSRHLRSPKHQQQIQLQQQQQEKESQ